MTRKLLKSLGVLIFLVGSASAQEERQSFRQKLSAEQLRSVQSVGHSVLAAKHTFTEDPEHARLRDQVDQLRKALTRVSGVLVASRGSVVVMQGAPQAGQAQGDRGGADLDDDSPNIQELRGIRQALRIQRLRLKASVDRMEERHPHRDLSEAVTAKVSDLEDELQGALQAPREARRSKLLKLRAELEAPALKRAPPVEAPALSTLAAHRE